MIRQVIRASTFNRDAYLRAVLSPNAAGDALIIVAAVYLVMAVAILPFDDFDLAGYLRIVISGGFSWLILSGAIYLVGRYGLEGEGSFQGVLAMTALAHPVLLLVLAARAVGLSPFLALLAGTVWFLAILVAGTRVALDLVLERAVLAVAGGYVLWLLFSRFLV
jgi:hypothetical protein